MKLNRNNVKALAAPMVAAVMLSACGGGGGEAVGNATTTTVATTTTTTAGGAASIVGVVSPANYVAGNDARNAYDYLNAQRQACGFGLLQQNAQLDTAAQGHTDYMLTNGMSLAHLQDSTKPGFTGTTLADRLTAAGYPTLGATEVVTAEDTTYGTNFGQANVKAFLSAPYHGIALLRSYRDFGVGVGTTTPAPGSVFPPNHIMTINLGTTTIRPAQLLATNAIATYPCSGSTGMFAKTYRNEAPAPIPGRNLLLNPIGTPIYLKVRDGQNLVLTSTDLREVGSNTSETLLPLSRANDTNNMFSDNSEVILIPNAPLKFSTTYRLQASGTNNGQALTVDFTFTTGAF